MSFPVQSLILQICERAGLPANRVDVSSLEGNIDGFIVTSEHSAFTFVRSLSEVEFFDPSNFDGVLHFVPRGGEVVATVDEQEVLVDVEEEDELDRRDTLAVPRVIHLSYYDLWGGLNPDKQSSERSVDSRSVGESTASTPVVMQANRAKQVVVITHKIAIDEQRGEYSFKLPDSYLHLSVSDIVLYRGHRLRITEVQLDDGFQSYKASFDRASAYSSAEEGIPPIEGEPVELDPGLTEIEAFDSHILTDLDDALGFYVAVTGASSAWKGALVELSLDDGVTYSQGALLTGNAIIGEVIDAFGDHPADYPDEANTLTVRIVSRDPDLSDATLAEMMNRANLALVGDEYINFGTAVETDPETGVWELSYLLRGRKGTPASAHVAGERFVVLLRGTLAFIPAELNWLNRTLTFRATTLGTDDQITTTTLGLTDACQRERAPAYLTGYRDGGGNVVLSWQGVGRLGGGATVAMGAYHRGYRITLDGTVYEQTTTSLTAPIPAGPTQIQVQQLNAYTGAGPAAEITV